MKINNWNAWIMKQLKTNAIIIFIIIVVNMTLLLLWFQSNLIITKELYAKNMEHGMTKCSEVVNDLDNIIYLGENIVNLIDRDYDYLIEKEGTSDVKEELIDQTFVLINENENYFEKLYLVDENKLFCAGDEAYEAIDPNGRPWYESALLRNDIVITIPYDDYYTGDQVVTISKKVGNSESVLGLDISQDEIFNILKKAIEDDQVVKSGFIINRDGIIVARTDGLYTGKSVIDSSLDNVEKLKPYYNEILTNESGQIMFDEGGYAYGLAYQKTASDWHVVYVIDKKVIGSETLLLKNQVILFLAISFIMLNAVILVYYIKRQRANRLKERAEKAEQDLLRYKDDLERLVDERTEKIVQQGQRLEELNTVIIDNMADIVEFRDLESGQHIKRIKKYVYLIIEKAIEIYPEYEDYRDKIEKICNVSALHDIGKIGITDTILLKPAKLTAEEFEEMKKHTIIGGSLAERILEKYDDDLKEFGYQICRYHHERCDGKGYPEGLKGEQIPFCAQVVGIADVYDALIEKRVYKEPYSHEKAIEMILNGECGKFSDKIINCLRMVEHEMKQISQNENELVTK